MLRRVFPDHLITYAQDTPVRVFYAQSLMSV